MVERRREIRRGVGDCGLNFDALAAAFFPSGKLKRTILRGVELGPAPSSVCEAINYK